MARIIDRPVEVVKAGRHRGCFRWNRRWYQVTGVADCWKETGRWWAGEGEKTFLRIQTSGGGVFEIYRDAASGEWYLYKIYD